MGTEDTQGKDHLAQHASFLFGCSQSYLPVWITPLLCLYFRNQSRCLLSSFIPFVSAAFLGNFFHMLTSLPHNGFFFFFPIQNGLIELLEKAMYSDIGQSASKDPQERFITFDDQDIYGGGGGGEIAMFKSN